uniref:Uncharacterized protein n=1 Tax=Arundo donax TaxID=35708 RepID=A0A0A9AG86_ARUDO
MSECTMVRKSQTAIKLLLIINGKDKCPECTYISSRHPYHSEQRRMYSNFHCFPFSE